MLRVLAVTGGKQVPSSIFRIRQYFKIVESDDEILLHEATPIMSCYTSYKGVVRLFYYVFYIIFRLPLLFRQFNYDVIWLQRELVPTFYTLERFIIKPLVYDEDDAVYLGNRNAKTQERISQRSSFVVVSTNYLATWYSRYSKTRVIPTVVDCDRYKKMQVVSDQMYLGWIGTSNNFWHLDYIQRSLSQFLEENLNWKLKIVSDRPYTSEYIHASKIEFVQWSLSIDVQVINSFNIGLMPLVDTEWTRGKASFKLIQYMACGVHAVASITGNNHYVGRDLPSVKLVQDPNWLPELNFLAQNLNQIDTRPAIQHVRKHFHVRPNYYLLKEIFYEVYNISRS